MGTGSLLKQTAILCVLLALPELGLCGCFLGDNNGEDFTRRNNTILYSFNRTLRNITMYNDQKIANFSNFQLWNYIQKTFQATFKNYLIDVVSMGKLLQHNWQYGTQGYTNNLTDNRTLESYIRDEFLGPLHNTLQEMAVFYSFSIGIFRPRQSQFNYTGVNASEILPYGNNLRALQANCIAGSLFVWRLATSMQYDPFFDNWWSIRIARTVNMVESSFDQYYRKHVQLGNDFIRVNVLNATNVTNYVVMFMEAYFINNSFTLSDITQLTDMNKIPPMYFNNLTSKPVLVTLNDAKSTYIVHAAIVANQTVTTSTTASTSMASTTNATAATTAAAALPIFQVTLPNLVPQITIQVPTTTRPVTSTTMPNTTTAPVLITTTNSPIPNTTLSPSPNTTIQTTSQNTTTTPSPTSLVTVSSTNSTTPVTSTSVSVTNASDTTTLATTASNSSYSSNSSTLLPSTNTPFQITSIVTTANLSGETPSMPSGGSNGTGINASLTTSNPNGQGGNTTTSGGGNTTGNGNGSAFGNQSTTDPRYLNRNGTTFDPDPYFQANVPVVKKIYNDEILLRKVMAMLPITTKMSFFSVTIPLVFGILVFVIFCMVCWQVDCCPARRKK